MHEIAVPHPPPRPDDSHKGTFGTVVIVGGCATMVGAPALAATAALRAGAGLVKIMTDATILPHCLAIEPSATGLVFPDSVKLETLRELLSFKEKLVLAVGPGMGVGQKQQDVLKVLLGLELPMVLDADGLNNLAALGSQFTQACAPFVLTPHPGEYRRLAEAAGLKFDPTNAGQRPAAAETLAQRYRCVIVLKGQGTVVSDGERCYVNSTGNPALATAGSGDVLTGVIASFMAQGMAAFEAAVLGVHIHGAAADLWATRHGKCGLLARELAGLIPDAIEARRKSR